MPVGAAVAVVGIVGGLSGKKSAKKDRRAELALQRETLDFNKQRYSDFKSLYGDLEQQLVAGAKEGVKADLAGVSDRAAADVAVQFQNAEGERLRNQQRLGINPNSGRAEAGARQLSLARAVTEAGNVTVNREQERRSAEEQTWNRRWQVGNLGVQQMNGAAHDMAGSMQTMAAGYGRSADQKMQQAGQMFSMAGQAAGMGMAGAFKGGGGQNTTTTPTLSAPDAGGNAPLQTSSLSQPEWLQNARFSS